MADEVVIKTVLDLSKSAQRTQRQIDAALRSAETKELAHQRRLEAIHLQSGSRLQQIEARRVAQLDIIRERAMQKEIERHRKLESSVRQFGDTMTRVGSRLTLGVSAPLIALGVAAVKTATDFDSLKRGLTAVSGSSAETEKQLVRLKEVAKLPGLGFREAIQGSTNLQAAGLSAGRAEAALKAFGNALATVGKGKAELDGVILALSQIESKGKVSAEEINQLAERIPQIRQIMLKAFGTADTEVIQRAKITSGKFIDTVTAELAKLPRVTGGARNEFENLKDSIEQSLLPLGNKLLQTILPALEKLSPKILGLLEDFGKLSDNTKTWVIGLGAATIAAGPLITAIGNLTKAVVALNAASATGLMARLLNGPVILTAAVVGTTAVQTFREATGAQEMIDKIGGPDLDRITRIMRQRGVSGADAFMRVAQELKDQALIGGLRKEQPGVRLPALSGAEAFARFGGGGKSRPTIDAVALAEANAAAAKAARAGRRDRFIDDFGLGEAEKLRHEAELARIRQSNLAVVLRRQAPPEGIGLPRGLAATALGGPESITGFPEQELRLLEKAADELERLPHLLSDSERFMKGFAAATRTVGDAFEQLGSDVAFAFTNVKSLFDSLRRAVLDFFNNLLGTALQNLVRGTLGPLFGGLGGSLGNLFRTPSFAGGGGISAPASISQGIGSFFSRGGGSSGATGIFANGQFAAGLAGGGGGGFSLGSLFSGFTGQNAAAATSLIGLQLGVALGGQSTAGRILGGAGGALGITSVLAAPLFGLGIFLGRSKQRRNDEEASGQMLTAALQAISELKAAIASDQIDGGQARQIFESQILASFISGINTLKTESVRKSRLTNQVRDLRKNFDDIVAPEIAAQIARRGAASTSAFNASRLIPEFASGGLVPGVDRGRDSVLSLLRPGELVLTRGQQASVMMQSNPGVFDRAGVPRTPMRVGGAQAFQFGGTAQANFGPSGEIVIENITVQVLMGKGDATRVFVAGGNTPQGRAVTVKNVNVARTNRELG